MYVYQQLPGSVWSAEVGLSTACPATKVTLMRVERFIVASISQHVSEKRWRYYTIPWSASLRLKSFNEVNGY
jgi:hypothetical protein